MADSTSFSLLGIDAVLKKMQALPREVRAKSARIAMGRAARLVAKAVRANARQHDDPETGRTIAQNVQARFATKTFRRTGDVVYRVGVATPNERIPKGNPDTGPRGETPHWHLLELGTENMRATPFVAPALSSNVSAATNVFIAELDKELDRIISST